MGNNPISNADPAGDLFFAIPQISFNGGFSIGLELGVGLPGVLSASVAGGYGTGGGYASIQGTAGGFTAGYGIGGGFASYGYQYSGFSGGLSYGSDGLSTNAGYGVGGKGLTTFGASGELSYNFSSGQLGYNVGAAYTYIFEKPLVEHQATYEKEDASEVPVEQRKSHDCLLGACEYIGPYDYDYILGEFTEGKDPLYVPGEGTKTLPALQKLYGTTQKLDQVIPGIADAYWKNGGNVLVAQNKNHAIVLNKIDQYNVTYKYRRNNNQTKYKFTYMNPATGTFQTSGLRSNYKYPTYYFNK